MMLLGDYIKQYVPLVLYLRGIDKNFPYGGLATLFGTEISVSRVLLEFLCLFGSLKSSPFLHILEALVVAVLLDLRSRWVPQYEGVLG